MTATAANPPTSKHPASSTSSSRPTPGRTLRVLASFSDADGTAHGPLASAAILAPLPRNVETTWQQPDPLRASELFRTESGLRGVLRLEGERWLRYALFGGGQAVPGSVDFSIALGDTIWLAD